MTPEQLAGKINYRLRICGASYRIENLAVAWILIDIPKRLPDGAFTGLFLEPRAFKGYVVYSSSAADVDFYPDEQIITRWVNQEFTDINTASYHLSEPSERKPYNTAKLKDHLEAFEDVMNLSISVNAKARMLDISETKYMNWLREYKAMNLKKTLDNAPS